MTAMLDTTPVGLDRDHPPAPVRRREIRTGEPRRFRPDIEGLRAIAVLAVVLYHADLLGLTGGYVGVDIFFVISGFLITRQLVTGVGNHGVRELPVFYARRIRRLLPASTVVVIATLLAAYAWAPALRLKAIAMDAIFTTFYGLNYRLADLGTDYQHANDAVSPLQHFWSLAVEEQFYVGWPLLIVAVFYLARRHRIKALVAVLTVLAVWSFWCSATQTYDSPSWSYFSLHTRAWELALGGLVALTGPVWTSLPRWATNAGAWFGLGVITACLWALDEKTVYPGTMAAIPVGACALVIACGSAPRFHSVERVLGEPVLQGIGKVSYSWYLWHWPMLILIPVAAGEALPWFRRFEIIVLALIFAILTYYLVENPVRHLQRLNFEWLRNGLGLAAAVLVVALVASNNVNTVGNGPAVKSVQLTIDSKATQRLAGAIDRAMVTKDVPSNLTPPASAGFHDFPMGCIADIKETRTVLPGGGMACNGDLTLGDPAGTKTIAVFGDSHAQHWGSGIDSAARTMHLNVIIRTRAACPPAEISVWNTVIDRQYTECDAWKPIAENQIIAAHPEFVIISESDAIGGKEMDDKKWADATVKTIKKFQDAGIGVIYMEDTPYLPVDVPVCVGDHLDDLQKCNVARGGEYSYPARHKLVAKEAKAAGATVVDPAKWLCNAAGCPAVVGNILAYRDGGGHLTHTFSRWLAPVLVTMLQKYMRANETSTSSPQSGTSTPSESPSATP
jgi:peptidoglycan/LPS O-acetylase OafA/YrhL